MWPFFQKSGCFISKIRRPLCCKRQENMAICKPQDYKNLLRHVTQAETTLFSFEELQSFDLPMTRFPFLLQHKGLLIFEMKQPLFWKNGHICPSLLAKIEKSWRLQFLRGNVSPEKVSVGERKEQQKPSFRNRGEEK